MFQAVFCAHSTETQIDDAVKTMKGAGVHPIAMTIISRSQELEWIACPQSKVSRSLQTGVIGGAVVGACIGMALLLCTPPLHNPWGGASLVVCEAFGWALFGMIVGSSGLLSRATLSAHLLRHFEEAIEEGKILISVQVKNRAELDRAAASLYQVGAADMHETSVLVA